MRKVDYLLLGDGYSAKRIRQDLKTQFPSATIVGTSRKGDSDIIFDLSDPATWENLPQSSQGIWTFPPKPISTVQKFFEVQKTMAEKWVVIGSTSAFDVSGDIENVNESTKFDANNERAQAEEYLRSQGAVMVMSSGIYGIGKSPIDWVKNGRVGKSEKFVNMIHVEDLSQFVINAGIYGEKGKIYIASDNNPQKWQDIISHWEEVNLVKDVPQKISNRTSKKIDSSQSIKLLKVNLKYRNFAHAVSLMNQ